MHFADDGEDATSPRTQDTFATYQTITCMGAKKEQMGTAGRSARDALKKWVCFFGSPDIILADKDA